MRQRAPHPAAGADRAGSIDFGLAAESEPELLQSPATKQQPRLIRETFRTSRLLEFCSKKELIAQTGHEVGDWPLVTLKELVDNAIDACEEADIAPDIAIKV